MWIVLVLVFPSWLVAAGDVPSENPALSLRGLNSNTTGFLHLYDAGTWHLVCTYDWHLHVAQVVCSQLGFHGNAVFTNDTWQNPDANGTQKIQYETFAECNGSEGRLQDCKNHDWLLVSLGQTDGKQPPCYVHESKAIHCSSSKQASKERSTENSGTQDSKQNTKQDITQDTKENDDHDSKPDGIPGSETETPLPMKTPTRKSKPSTTTTIADTTEDESQITTESHASQDDLQTSEITTKDTKPSGSNVDSRFPVVIIRPTQTKTPKPYADSADKKPVSEQLDNLTKPSTSAMQTEEMSETTAEENQETTLSPLDRYLYFKQSDLISVTTMTTLIPSTKTPSVEPSTSAMKPSITKPSTSTSTMTSTSSATTPFKPSTTAQLVYMVTPKDYKPSTASSDTPWAPKPRSKDTHTPSKAAHPGLRPGYPWGGHYGNVGDREIDKLHPRFLDSKYELDFKDCPGYTNTFVGTRQEGQITSPAYPERYPNHSHCVWRIHVHPSQHIRLQIMDLWTEKGDTLKVFESAHLGEQPHLIRSYQGKVLDLEQLLEDRANNSITIFSNHSVVYLEFSSNSKGRARGFLVDYKALPHIPTSLSRLLAADNIQFIQTLVGVLVAMALVVMVAAVVIYRLKYPASKSDVRRRLYEEAVNDLHRDYSTMSKDPQPNGDVASLSVFNKSSIQVGGRDVSYENPAFSTDTPDMSSVFMEAGKSDEEILNWGNDDEEETSVIFSIFSRKNKKKKKKCKKMSPVSEEQTAVFDDQPDTPCNDLIELDNTPKEQAGFSSIQSAFGQSSSLGKSPVKSVQKPNPKGTKLQSIEANLIDLNSPRKIMNINSPRKSVEKNDTEDKPEPEDSKAAEPDEENEEEPKVVVDVNAKSLDSDMIGRVTAEMISPREFICPITTKIMKQPVRAPDGFMYEKRAITEWIEQHGLSPISRTQMKVDDLMPADDVAAKVKEWRKKRRQQRQKMETQLTKAKEAGSNIIC